MEQLFRIFHWVSHVKYPLMALGVYYAYLPVLTESENALQHFNTAFIIMGIAISLDSLKDYNKLNWIDKQIYHRPNRAKVYFSVWAFVLIFNVFLALYIYLFHEKGAFKELSLGLLIFSLSCFGVLRAGLQATKDYMKENKLEEKDVSE